MSIARAICSRWVATAAGTPRSSAFIKSTISREDARSIDAVRRLRRSVSRESNINALPSGEPRTNLPAASRELQDNLERDYETFSVAVCTHACRRVASCGTASFESGNTGQSVGVVDCRNCRLYREPGKRWKNCEHLELRQLNEFAVQRIVGARDRIRAIDRGGGKFRERSISVHEPAILAGGARNDVLCLMRCASQHDDARRHVTLGRHDG